MEISTAAEFKKGADGRRAEAAVPVVLPSGLRVKAYQPKPEWWLRHLGRLPQSMAAKLAGAAPKESQTSQDLLAFALWASKAMSEIIVAPRVTLNPGPDEIDPSWISDEDFEFLIRFAGGEIAADGQGLDTFSGKSATDAPSGADRANVQ